MFLKPFRVKKQSSIKGSDRKKLRAEICKQYDLEPSVVTEMIPNKDEMSVSKLSTHSGETPVVYSVLGNPVFFELDNILYPTVYTLWKFPDMLPVFTTWPPVFTKLTGGADLMLPGVYVKGPVTPYTFGKLKKGDACSVKILGNKAPVAIGTAGLSASDMYESAMRGKGVIVLHSFTDHLWALGDKSNPPQIEDSEVMDTADAENSDEDLDGEEDEEIQHETDDEKSPDTLNEKHVHGETSAAEMETLTDMEQLSLDEVAHGASDKHEPDEDEERVEEEEVEREKKQPEDEEVLSNDPKSIQESMDELLGWCFLCALKTRVKKSDLPLLTSNFFRNHLQPCCPSGKMVDVKKSSYKKLSKFLQAMQKQGFIKVKELTKGVESIIEVTRDHPELRQFAAPDMKQEEPAELPTGVATNNFTPPEITEMFIVNAASSGFFKLCGHSKGSALTAVEVRKCLTDYVREAGLSAERGSVQLDAVLSDFLLTKSEYNETLRWEDLMTRALNKMSPGHRLTIPSQASVVKKGKLEPISMNVAQRGGNKKVTLIHGLEQFGIDPEEFAHHIQIGRACSTSISERPGKNQGLEVLVQGNQTSFIADSLLNKYKIPRKYLIGLEKAPKDKKKR